MKFPSVKRTVKRKMDKPDKSKSEQKVQQKVQKVKIQSPVVRFFSWLLRGFFALAKMLVLALVDTGIAVFVACVLVPISVVTVSNLSGVGFDNSIGNIIFLLGFPCAFLLALWVVFTLWLLRFLNNQIRIMFGHISLLGGIHDSGKNDSDKNDSDKTESAK